MRKVEAKLMVLEIPTRELLRNVRRELLPKYRGGLIKIEKTERTERT